MFTRGIRAFKRAKSLELKIYGLLKLEVRKKSAISANLSVGQVRFSADAIIFKVPLAISLQTLSPQRLEITHWKALYFGSKPI